MKKPYGCTFPDCFICPLDDCEFDKEAEEEVISREIEDIEILIENLKANKREGERLRDDKLYKKLLNRRNYLVNRDYRLEYQQRWIEEHKGEEG